MPIQTDIIDALEFSVTDYKREMGEGLFTLDELPLRKAFRPAKRLFLMAFRRSFIFIFERILAIHYFLFMLTFSSQYEGLLGIVYKKGW